MVWGREERGGGGKREEILGTVDDVSMEEAGKVGRAGAWVLPRGLGQTVHIIRKLGPRLRVESVFPPSRAKRCADAGVTGKRKA